MNTQFMPQGTKWDRDNVKRIEELTNQITLPFGWQLETFYETHTDNIVMQVRDKNALCNVSGDRLPWSGRKFTLSPFMVDGEIVQTAFLATMTASEHETREGFLFKGVSVFDPHYDIHKLVALRKQPNALAEREDTRPASMQVRVVGQPLARDVINLMGDRR